MNDDNFKRILRECRYQIIGVDMLTSALSAIERANLDMDFMEALVELYPDCEAIYFQNCGKLIPITDIRSCQVTGPDRFIHFGVRVFGFWDDLTGAFVLTLSFFRRGGWLTP